MNISLIAALAADRIIGMEKAMLGHYRVISHGLKKIH